ncbi:MAG: hypothetical protein COU42_02120 [Candidatus Nealsonbacteria bacterium CG10_big_fil_rev_8_21_14_0_10_36_24]|uniref:Helix-turn-helix domain-containing protein n=2 Tax=Candidatus Nealsoniibacteriota TaxID=1817911 RepID=A0A2H0YNL6_9BACT|nr:MAG: hypothetical protein COU42_02120 [Candidatus Nealsonbacteria bacterium CG10_big_fil_rev_8_21_14_0_10_36_24]PIS40097.1 MAG: hypothetical protein COT32_01565 [Candidatus Nealsonbacteria bacterium CG08_land_8_20_14_0_20_36_22]
MSRIEKEGKFISLQEAVKFCEHSQEYLSLRARQGKLKAVKFGRNWVTKKEWLDTYMASAENYKNNIKNNGKKLKKLREVKAIRKEVFPPKNLPVGNVVSEFFQTYFQKPNFHFGFALAMVLVLMIAAVGLLGKDSLKTVTDDVANVMLVAESKISEDEIYSAAVYDTAGVFKNYFKWIIQNPVVKIIEKNVKFVWQNGREGYKEFVLNWLRPSKPEPAKEGLVVIPSTEKDEEIKVKIKESFSDEVKVELTDKTSGIITPVFKTGEGDRYLYILVPIKN